MSGKRITRRRFLARLGAIGGMAALAAACGPTPTPKVVEKVVTQVVKEMVKETVVVEKAVTKEVIKEVPAKAERITLRVQTYGGTGGMKHREFSKFFMDMNPNIDVKHEETVYAEIAAKTEMGFATKNLQDILYGHSEWLWIGCYKGFYRPLDELIKAAPPPNWDDFYKSVIENEKFPDDGKIYSIPDRFHLGGNIVVTWNREILKAAGVKEPVAGPEWTMEKLKEMALKCTDKAKGIFGLEFSSLTHQLYVENLARAWGKPSYGRKGDTRGWIVGPDMKTFQWYKALGAERFYNDIYRPLIDARAHPLTADQVEGGLFVAGREAFTVGTHATPAAVYLRIANKWPYHPKGTVLLTPVGPEGRQPQCHSSNMMMISTLTKYPAEALRCIGAMTSTEAGVWDILTIGGTPIARHSVLTHPKVLEINPALEISDKLAMAGWVEPYPQPWNFRYKELMDIFKNTTDHLWAGTKTWEEQAPTVQKDCQKLMDQPRP